jgi:hypothetical protein
MGAGSKQVSPFADITEEQIGFIVREAAAWLQDLHDRHRPNGRPLTAEEKRRLAGFFERDVLDAVRVTLVERFENPEFFSIFTEQGKPVPIDFSSMAAQAAHDTILVRESRSREGSPSLLPLLFHELVHVVQHRVLGAQSYVETYVTGWAGSGFAYRSIPMEVQAYELDGRFRSAPGEVFSVEREVRLRFAAD